VRPRPWSNVSVAELAASQVQSGRRAQAEGYAATLRAGDHIWEETDGPTIAPFRALLPAALALRGLQVETVPGGWVVRAVLPERPMSPVTCLICGGSWFSCGHGVGMSVRVG
jgi:hypothetical protein